MSKEDNKHPDIAKINRAISRWQTQESLKKKEIEIEEQKKREEKRKEELQIKYKKDQSLEEYISIYRQMFPSSSQEHKKFVKKLLKRKIRNNKLDFERKINYIKDNNIELYKTLAIKPCPNFCTSSKGEFKWLYIKEYLETITPDNDEHSQREYKCPSLEDIKEGFHLTSKSEEFLNN